MKLAMSINVFDGVELLPYQLKQIRKHVDFILVHSQSFSYYGHPLKEEDYKLMTDLQKQGLIDQISLFGISQFAKNPAEAKVLERSKRNRARRICYEKGMTHFIDCDADEFYKEKEFKKAKDYIKQNGIEYSAVKLFDYFHLPIYKKKSFNSCIVPFICKLDSRKELGGASFFGKTDPTRGYMIFPEEKSYMFDPYTEIACHHMVGIRKDLNLKYAATSRGKLDRTRIPEIIENIKSINKNAIETNSLPNKFGNIGNEFEVVDNYFEIPLEEFL